MAQNNFIVDLIANLNTTLFNRQMRQLQNQRYNVNVGVNNNNLKNTHAQMRQLGTATQNTNTVFGKLKNTISNTFSAGRLSMTGFLTVLNEINKAGRNAKETIKEIDKAITDLSVATNMSREAVSGLVKEYNSYAKDLKSTTTQITDAADDYLRAGKTMSEAQELIKSSIMLSKLGQIDSGEATEDLLATMNGFNMSVEEVGKALDAMVAIDMKAATSSGDIATALKYCASSADMAGVSFNKLAAMIGTVQDKTQQSAETVGTFMNTLLSRYRNVKIGQFVDDDGEDLSEVETILKSVNIQLRDSNQSFRDFETVIDEVATSWSDYSDVQQAAIAKAFSGTRQQNRFIALMEGYDKTLELTEVAANSAGTAVEKFNKSYADSLEAKKNTLQASFESLIMNSDLDKVYSGILEATNALVQFINKANALKGVFTSLAVTGGIKAFLSIKTGVTQAYIALNQFQQALNLVKQPKIATNDFTRLLMLTKNLSESQMKLILSSKSLTLTQKKQLLMNQNLSESEARLKLQNMGLATSYTGLKAATVSVTNACKGLFSTLLANPIFLVATAVSVATMAWQSYKQSIEETRQANMDAATSAKEEADSLNELYIQYSKLSSITDKTSQQEDDFKQVVQDITKALGNKADALENVTIGTDEYAKSLREATKAELESQYATAKIGAKAAEEVLKDKTYSGWDGSQITIAKNEQMTAIKEHVAALEAVQDILAKYEDISSNGVEWEPIGWDENRNDMNAVLEYYYDLIEARDRLATDDNADFLMSSDIYKSINTTINSLSESVKNYTEQQYNALKLQYEWQSGIPRTEEEFKAMESSILSASGAGEEFQKVLKDFLINDFASFFPEETDTEIAKTEQASKKLFDQLTSSKESLDKFQSSVESAYDSYAKLMNPNVSSSDILSSIQSITSAVSDMGGSLNWEFIDGQSNSLELLGNAIEEISRKYAESVLSGAGIDVDSKFGQMLANNIIQAQKASIELENLNDGLDSLQSAYSSLTDIVEAYNETGYLTFDQLQTLLELEPQYLACLLDENGQLKLNEQATSALANQRLNDAEAQAVQQAITELGQLALQDEQKAVEDNATAFTNAIDDLAGYNQELANTIAEATVGASAIRDLNAAISGAQSQGATDDQINTVLSNLETKLKLIGDVRNKVQSGGLGAVANPKSASKSGKKDADAYLEAFEKEYKKLKDKLDRGEITEKEYLDNLRALYERYFRDREEYLDEFEKYEQEYLEGMESLYKDVIDGICDLIDKQADKYDDLKDSAVDSYEAQKEAAEDAYDAQIDAIQAQIDAIDEEIEAKKKQADAIQDEIDKIRKAREERQKKIDLQKKEYELQRMQNQNTKLTYTSEKGFIFTPDTQGIRDAREAVDEAKEELYILQLEKQIDLINDEIDALEERKDALEKQKESIEKMKDASNEYYDSLIKKTEEFYDKLIDTLDKTKSRWQELADLKEEAEMKQKMEEVLNQYGITANDIVNMSEEAFNAFKNDYLNILSDLYSGNEQMQSAIAETAGTTTDKLGSYIASTQEYIDSLGSTTETLQPVADAIDTTAKSVDNLDTSASNASKSTSQIASDMKTLNTNSDGVSENIDGISDALTSIPDSNKFDAVATSFEHLGKAIKGVADALGIGTEGTVGGLVTALQEISTLSLDNLSAEGGTGIISQFNNLKTAVEKVTSAIGGGMGNTGETGTSQNANSGSEGAQGSSGSLIGALGELKSTADETLGSGGDGENNGEGGDEEGEGVIGKFAQFKSAVDAVTMAIGTGEEEDGYNENGAFTLIGALQAQYDKAAEVIPAEKSLFEELLGSIMACVDALVQMSSAIGSLPGIGGGNAYASGTRNAEKGLALVGEEKPEVIVTNDDKVLIAEKPSLVNMEGGETVYNGNETEKMLNSNGVKSLHKGQPINTTNAGNAYAKGTDDGTIVMKDGTVLRPLREGDEGYDLIKKAELYFEKFGNQMIPPVNAIDKNMEMMARNISNVNNNNNMANYSVGDVHIHCPGVTKDEVVKQIGDEMTKTFFGLSNKALQRANITR